MSKRVLVASSRTAHLRVVADGTTTFDRNIFTKQRNCGCSTTPKDSLAAIMVLNSSGLKDCTENVGTSSRMIAAAPTAATGLKYYM